MNLLLIAALMVTDTATFAGGCFWSMERAFDQLDGVVSVTVGYAGGREAQPTYQQVSTQADGQFCDHGPQYHTAVFYRDSTQHRAADASKRRLEARFQQPIVTVITPAGRFYPAEEYHQHYYRKNPISYQAYRWGCGRDRRLKEVWGAEAPHAEAER